MKKEKTNKKLVQTRIRILLGTIGVSVLLIVLYRVGTTKTGTEETPLEGAETSYSFAMGTSVAVSLYDADKALCSQLEQAIKQLDQEVISWRQDTSELAVLNHSYRSGEAYTVSDTLYTAIVQSLNICKDSGGALDITIRPLANVWNIENATAEDFEIPSDAEINEALKKVGYESVACGDDQTVTINTGDRILDLGAVGKGFALDIVEQILKKESVPGATISVGGSILVYGSKSDGSSFHVGIRDPEGNADDYVGYLELEPDSNLCISTSGDYEKYIEKDGIKYHHILDRATGYPAATELASVTVVCANGLYSDALSTACYVLGYERSQAILEKYHAEAVFIDHAGNITVTQGLQEHFHKAE